MNNLGKTGDSLLSLKEIMRPLLRPLVFVLSIVAVGAAAAADDPGAPVLSAAPAIGQMSGSRADQLKAAAYVEHEFFLEGAARSYVKRGECTFDGAWDAAPGESAPYKIRLLAR